MGNKISRRRDTRSEKSAETAEDPAAPQPAEEPEVPQTVEATEDENLDVVVGEIVTEDACLPSEECTSEMKQPKSPAAALDTEDDVEPGETPAPVQPEPLVSIKEPPSKPEPAEEPKPAVAAQLAPEPEPALNLQTEAEVVPEPISEPQTDTLTQETLPKPVISSSTLVDVGVPDVTLQPVIAALSQAPTHNPVNADKPLDIPRSEECRDQDAEMSTPEPEKPGETSDSLKEPVEAAGNLLVCDVSEDSVSSLLKNLELQGNDLVADVKMPDETPSADVCSSTELM